MLIRFSVQNWMSFRDEATLSMIASRERQHNDRVPRINKYQTRVLPIASIYGGNASGKTNFFLAISFARKLVIEGTRPEEMIPAEPFLLDSKSADGNSTFRFEILVNDTIYEFSFTLNANVVVEERLIQILSTSEKTLYHRKNGNISFDKALDKDGFLSFVRQGTRDNQLFLTNSISQKVETFKPVYDWFKHSLMLISPDTRFAPFEHFIDEKSPLHGVMNQMLASLDTGILHLGGEEIPLDSLSIPAPVLTKLKEVTKEGKTTRYVSMPGHERYTVTRENGELVAKKLITYHRKADGTPERFDILKESDGSKRIIDLLPAFLDISEENSHQVVIIDEVDRSLHTLLTRRLLEMFLSTCSENSRSQLLFTTHDVLLMDQSLLRRDEMWVTERKKDGSAVLYPFSDFKDIRYDKDIRKSYLQGRLGGIPRLLNSGFNQDSCKGD